MLNGVLPEVKAGMQTLMEADVLPPDQVGYEHAHERGEVDAEAAAAWLAAHVVVLTEAQMESASIWQAQGWATVLAQKAGRLPCKRSSIQREPIHEPKPKVALSQDFS